MRTRGKEKEKLKKRIVQGIFKSEKSLLFFWFLGGVTKLMKTCDFLKFYTLYFSGGIWLPLSKGVSLAVDPLGMRTFDLLTVSLVEASATGCRASSLVTCLPFLPETERSRRLAAQVPHRPLALASPRILLEWNEVI